MADFDPSGSRNP